MKLTTVTILFIEVTLIYLSAVIRIDSKTFSLIFQMHKTMFNILFLAGLLADPSVFHTNISERSTRDQYIYNGKSPRISVEA